MLAQASVVLHHARTFTGPTTTASLHIWVTDTHTPVFVYSSICIYTHQFLINIYNYIYIYKHILNSSTDTVTNKPRDCHHCILIPEEFLTVVKSFEVNQPTPLIAYNATHCHAKIDRSSYKTAKLMNSENTDIMYLDFSNALHQVPHKISFAWSIQIGLDMSTATQFNKRQIKASWQSSNKTRRWSIYRYETPLTIFYLSTISLSKKTLAKYVIKSAWGVLGPMWPLHGETQRDAHVLCSGASCDDQRLQLITAAGFQHLTYQRAPEASTCALGLALTGDFTGVSRGREALK